MHSPTAVAPGPATAEPRRPVVRLNRAGMVVLIGSFTLLPAVASDMYLPSLPEVATDLSTSAAGAQFTITGMVLGGAMGTLMVGPISDRYGRRRPALVGISGHVVTSLLCMVAPTIGVLIGLRLVQGFMAASATVSAIAVVRDLYNGAEVAHFMSRIMLVIGAAPLLAPSLGAVIATHGGWRAVFGWLAAARRRGAGLRRARAARDPPAAAAAGTAAPGRCSAGTPPCCATGASGRWPCCPASPRRS